MAEVRKTYSPTQGPSASEDNHSAEYSTHKLPELLDDENKLTEAGWSVTEIKDGVVDGTVVRHAVLTRRTPRLSSPTQSVSGISNPQVYPTHPASDRKKSLSDGGNDLAVITPYGPTGSDRDREPRQGCSVTGTSSTASANFGALKSVQAMGAGGRAIRVGCDTEFHYENSSTGQRRVIDSYQFCVADPLDPSMMVEIIFLPLSRERLRISTALMWVVRLAGLHLHDLAHEDFGPDGVGRRSYWSREAEDKVRDDVAAEELTGEDARYEVARRRNNLLFKRRLPITLLAHYGAADLTTFRWARYDPDLLTRLTSAGGGLVTLRPFRVHAWGESQYWRYPISVTVRDTLTHAPAGMGSLKSLGETCGVPKLEVPDGWISRMGEYRREHLREFLEYGINDARICVEYASRVWGEGTAVPLTLSSAAARAMVASANSYWGLDVLPKAAQGSAFREKFGGLVKEDFGLVQIEREDRLSYYEKKGLIPVDGAANHILTASANAYHGGANGCGRVGFFPKKTYDLDVKNAYPTLMSIVRDLDYRRGALASVIHEKRIDRYMICDPMIPFMGYVRFEFPESVKYPCLPVNVDGALVYPRTSTGRNGVWVTGPELYLALQLGAEVFCQIGYFGRVLDLEPGKPSFSLRHGVKQLITDRERAKEIFGKGSIEEKTLKTGVNSIYGKTAQDVSEQRAWDAYTQQMEAVGGSAITSPYHAAMTTSGVRALLFSAMNELETMGFAVYSWTTDGFITDAPVDVVESLELYGLAEHVHEGRESLVGDRTIWEAKHEQSDLLNFTTRGNNSLEPGGVNARNGFKLPAEVEKGSFEDRVLMRSLVATRAGRVPNSYKRFPPFAELSRPDNRRDFIVYETERQLPMDFDLKRKPVKESITPMMVDVAGEQFEVATFDTEPWDNVDEAKAGRALGAATGKDRSGTLRTVDDWDTYFLRLEHGAAQGRRVVSHQRSVLKSLAIGHRQRFFDIPNLGAKTNTQSFKCEWLSSWGLGSFSKSDWDNARKPSRVSEMLPEEHLEPWLSRMLVCPVGHIPSTAEAREMNVADTQSVSLGEAGEVTQEAVYEFWEDLAVMAELSARDFSDDMNLVSITE